MDNGSLVTLDLYEETPAGLASDLNNDGREGDQLGAQLLRALRCKQFLSNHHYDIYLPPGNKDDESQTEATDAVGRVVSNSVGTVYTIMERVSANAGQAKTGWREVCSVIYDVNIMGKRGPRKMTAVIRAVDDSGTPAVDPADKAKRSLADRYREDKTDEHIVTLWNKMPEWCDESRAYVLDFGGRVRLPSVKNFQLMHPDDEYYTVLQFGRVGPDSFTLDMRFPMTPLMALGIAVSSVDRKLACS
ncbi:Tubby- protein 2 [Kickxella alabastrina]|nr:Tubby- protein 2 [Kickxella alabastrina]